MADLNRRDGGQIVAEPNLVLDPGFTLNSQIVLEGRLDIIENLGVATFVPNTLGKLIEATAGVVELSEAEVPPLWTYKAADYAVAGRVVTGTLVASLLSNAVAAASKLEPVVFSVSTPEGPEKKIKLTVAAVTGSGFIIEPAKERVESVKGSPFALVDGTTYCLGLINPKATAAKSRIVAELNLNLSHV